MTNTSPVTLETRVTRIEDVLPQPATRVDFESLAQAMRIQFSEINERIDQLGAEMRVLHESLKGDIQVLAASVLSLHAKSDAHS